MSVEATAAATAPPCRRTGTYEQRAFGFWLYLMSDAVIFALLFATYAVMVGNTRRRADRQEAVQTWQCRRSRRRCCCTST